MGDKRSSGDDSFEDDGRNMITINSSAEEKMYMSPRGVGLDLSYMADSKSGHSRERDPRSGAQEESVLVVFDLPDGSQSESYFRLGQTVEFLKSFIESEFGIPMREQVLTLEGKKMIDPLSLLDYPEAKGKF
jgi:hypothetical protein